MRVWVEVSIIFNDALPGLPLNDFTALQTITIRLSLTQS